MLKYACNKQNNNNNNNKQDQSNYASQNAHFRRGWCIREMWEGQTLFRVLDALPPKWHRLRFRSIHWDAAEKLSWTDDVIKKRKQSQASDEASLY